MGTYGAKLLEGAAIDRSPNTANIEAVDIPATQIECHHALRTLIENKDSPRLEEEFSPQSSRRQAPIPSLKGSDPSTKSPDASSCGARAYCLGDSE